MSPNINNKILLLTINPAQEPVLQLALYYLKAYVDKFLHSRRECVRVDIAVFSDGDADGAVVQGILAKDPAMIGISCYVWNITRVLEIARAVKKLRPDISIVLGGPEVTPRAHQLLEENAAVSVVVRGEGERPFLDLVKWRFLKDNELSSIKGISYRQDDKVFSNPDMPPFTDLDPIPSPFLRGQVPFSKDMVVLFETMRGCPYRCHYCYDNKGYKKVRYFSLSRIEKELKLILAQKPWAVFMIDPTFNADGAHAKTVLRYFIKYNQGSQLRITIKAEHLDDEMIGLLARSNTCMADIGVQSIHARTLKAINRTFPLGLFKKNVEKLKAHHIPFELQLIDMLPLSTYSDLKRSLDWVLQFQPPRITIFRLMMLPGTYLREHAQALGMQYDPQPPYYLHKTKAMPAADVKKLEALCRAVDVLYTQYSLRKTLLVLKDRFKVPMSTIFEEWIAWEKTFYQKRTGLKEGGRKGGEGAFLSAMPDFLKVLCRKFNDKTAYDLLIPVLKEESFGAMFYLEKARCAGGMRYPCGHRS